MRILSLWYHHIGTSLPLCRTTCCRCKHQGKQTCTVETSVVLPPWKVRWLTKTTGFSSDPISGQFLELSDSLRAVLTVSCRWRCCTENLLHRGYGRRRSIPLWPAEAQLCESCFKFFWLVITQQFPSWAPCLPITLPRYKPGKRALSPLPLPTLFFFTVVWLMAAPMNEQMRGRRYLCNEQQIN